MHSSCVGVAASKGLASSLVWLSTSDWSEWHQSMYTALTAGRYCICAKLLMKQLMVLLSVPWWSLEFRLKSTPCSFQLGDSKHIILQLSVCGLVQSVPVEHNCCEYGYVKIPLHMEVLCLQQ